jgi:hypothetical protein
MMETLRRVSPDKLPQLQQVLSLPRSAQLLMDATIGDEQVVNPKNVEEIMRVVRKAAILDLTVEAENKLEAQRSDYEKQLEQVRQEGAEAQSSEATLRAAVAGLTERIEAFTAEQSRLTTEKELSIQYAISGCVRELVLRRQRMVRWIKLGMTFIGVPALVYATFVTSSLVSASPLVVWISATLMAAISCSFVFALWQQRFASVQRWIAGRSDDRAMTKLEQRLTLMQLNVHLSAVEIDWRMGQVNWKQRREGDVGPQPRLTLDAGEATVSDQNHT